MKSGYSSSLVFRSINIKDRNKWRRGYSFAKFSDDRLIISPKIIKRNKKSTKPQRNLVLYFDCLLNNKTITHFQLFFNIQLKFISLRQLK